MYAHIHTLISTNSRNSERQKNKQNDSTKCKYYINHTGWLCLKGGGGGEGVDCRDFSFAPSKCAAEHAAGLGLRAIRQAGDTAVGVQTPRCHPSGAWRAGNVGHGYLNGRVATASTSSAGGFRFKVPPRWPSGYGVSLESGRSGVRIPLVTGFFWVELYQ